MFNEKLKRDIMKQYSERLIASNRIVYCQMTLTHRCQYSCSHCYHKEIDGNYLDMPFDDAISIIEFLDKFSKAKGKTLRVDFTGGDPLLYPQLSDVIECCNRKRIIYGVKCNPDRLMMLTAQKLKKLLPGCTGISLSLDGPKVYNDAIRGNGSFDRVLSAARIINKAGVFLRINATISKANAMFLPALLQALSQSDVRVEAFTWARYWSLEEPQSVVSLYELPAIFDAYLSTLERLYENESFFLRSDSRNQPRINSLFKEHLWLPYLFQKGYVDGAFIMKARGIANSLNCSAMRDSFIADSIDRIYKCRKSSAWTADLQHLGDSVIGENCLGACARCLNRNICLGCSAMCQKVALDEDECPYFERALFISES